MISAIKITSLTNIGANLSYTSVLPIVDLGGTATTKKANVQILGNYILSQAGGANFVRAAQADISLSVANAAQPNITSVGTLTSLQVTGNISGGNLSSTGTITATGNSSAGNLSTTGRITATGNIAGLNILAPSGNVICSNVFSSTIVYGHTLSAESAFLLPKYASNGARDAAIPSPIEALMVYVIGSGLQIYGATQWNEVSGTGT